MNLLNVDVCVIGAGSGGLSLAAGAAQMGAAVALVEAGKMGGDCLNYGCIPSKSLLAAAKAAQNFRDANHFGISAIEPQIDFNKVMAHVQGVIANLSYNDSVERFTKLGVQVFQTHAHFTDEKTLLAGDVMIRARRYVIATGSSPAIPLIQGLDQVPFYTNETIFNLTKTPEHLVVIGGGPIGCELAQAFLFLATKVTVLEAFTILPKDEKELVNILRTKFKKDGLKIYENAKVISVAKEMDEIKITFEILGQRQSVNASTLLIATGRRANINDLNLEVAKINYSQKGIQVDAHLRTTNKHVYAIGDVIGGYQFTHIANYHAGIVIRNILFRWPAKVDYRSIPWVTYTDPELAHAGMLSSEAQKQYPDCKILTCDFSENDRAQTQRETLGRIVVITTKKGKILGVNILGEHAGELLLPWITAIQKNKSLRDLTDVIVPYPTLSEISKRVAGQFYTPFLFSERIKKLVRFLRIFG